MIVEYAGQKVDLLPCPFCGGEPAIHSYRWRGIYYRIFCIGDDCPIRPVTQNNRILEQAAADWNHRPKEGKL